MWTDGTVVLTLTTIQFFFRKQFNVFFKFFFNIEEVHSLAINYGTYLRKIIYIHIHIYIYFLRFTMHIAFEE